MDIKIVNSKTGTLEEKQLSAAAGEYLIGRHPGCDLVFEGSEVSRVHGRILCRDGGFYYADLGSSAGSWVNNEEVTVNQRYPLKANDTVRIGSYLVVIENVTPGPVAKVADDDADDADGTPAATSSAGETDGRWWQGEDLEAICKGVIPETEDVKTFVFAGKTEKLFAYQPGQFVTLRLQIDGKPIQRSYSISSTPTRPHTLEITVKRVPSPADEPDAPAGLVSNWLHDNIQPGSTISISGPLGKFSCHARTEEKLLFISAGSGITPMMSMSRWLLDRGSDADIVFFHSARSPRDIIFQRELELLSARHPNFRLVVAVTRPPIGQPWWGFSGRLDGGMLQAIAPDYRDRIVYTCGPDGFMKHAKALFADLEFPMENYFQESFGAPKRKAKAPAAAPPAPSVVTAPASPEPAPAPAPAESAPAGPPAIAFVTSKEEFPCEEGKSILEVALEEGIEIDHACCSGACGTCQVKLISGQHKYLQEPTCEPEAGHILTCVATAVGRVEIEA